MPIAVACPSCAKQFNIPESAAGKTARCKACGQAFKIPASRSVAPGFKASRTVDDDELERLRNAPLDDDDDDDDDLQELPEEDDDRYGLADAPMPARASAPPHEVSKPQRSFKAKRAATAASLAPLPLIVFFGGSAALWGFLLGVVYPSLQGREGEGGAGQPAVAAAPVPAPAGDAPAAVGMPPNGIPDMPGLPPDLEQARRLAPRAGANGFPQLPAPDANLYPAGRPPANGQPAAGAIREDVLALHLRTYEEILGYFDQMRDVLNGLQDASGARAAQAQLQAILARGDEAMQRYRTLPPLAGGEARELANRVRDRGRRTFDELRKATARISTLPGLAIVGMQLTPAVTQMSSGFERGMAFAGIGADGGPGGSRGSPYVDVFVEGVPDGETAAAVRSRLEQMSDDPNGGLVASSWSTGTRGGSFRVWPVADAAAFAQKIDFGTPSVSGHEITVTALKLTPEMQAAAKDSRRDEEMQDIAAVAARGGRAEEPEAPAGADAITKALFKLKSENGFKQREGLEELAKVIPDDERRDEVVKAAIPIATGTDHFSAIAAIKTLSNWVNDEAIDAMIHVVTRSDDHFVRVEAIGALGKLKTAKAAEAIASRLSEDWVDAPKALRNIGPAAEPALIALLTDGDPRQRRGACEVLADLGGAATFEAMLKLPADSDPFAQRAARAAMEAIGQRLGPDEVKRLQAAARKKS